MTRDLSFSPTFRRKEYLHGLVMAPINKGEKVCASYVFANVREKVEATRGEVTSLRLHG